MILIAGDTHGNLLHWRYLTQVATEKGINKIFQVGDFGYWEHMREGVEFLDHLNASLGIRRTVAYFLDGNHDKTSLILAKYGNIKDNEGFLIVRPHIRYAPRGHRWTWGRTRFIALGGAYSVDKGYRLELERRGSGKAGRYWFPEEEMSDEDMAKILTDTTSVDVILAHDKPRASQPSWNRKQLMDCLPNQDRLQLAVTTLKPKLFVHGHLHWRYTDTIRSGDETHTHVEGLHCDPDAATHWPYDPEKSWILFDEGAP